MIIQDKALHKKLIESRIQNLSLVVAKLFNALASAGEKTALAAYIYDVNKAEKDLRKDRKSYEADTAVESSSTPNRRRQSQDSEWVENPLRQNDARQMDREKTMTRGKKGPESIESFATRDYVVDVERFVRRSNDGRDSFIEPFQQQRPPTYDNLVHWEILFTVLGILLFKVPQILAITQVLPREIWYSSWGIGMTCMVSHMCIIFCQRGKHYLFLADFTIFSVSGAGLEMIFLDGDVVFGAFYMILMGTLMFSIWNVLRYWLRCLQESDMLRARRTTAITFLLLPSLFMAEFIWMMQGALCSWQAAVSCPTCDIEENCIIISHACSSLGLS